MPWRVSRILALVATLACAVLVASPAGAADSKPGRRIATADALEAQVLAQLNQVRAEHGLGQLRLSPALAAAADQHTQEMAADGYFAHESADGSAFWKRLERFYGSKGYRSWSVGENLVWASPGLDAPEAIDLWMKSPEHRANMLGRRWREVGLSAVHVVGAGGVFDGMDVTIVTADFGVRR